MSSKQRIYEVAKQIQVDHKELVSLVQSWGLTEIKNYMSAIDGDVVERIKRHYERLRQPAVVEERGVRGGVVVRRRAAPASPSTPGVAAPPAARESAAVPPPPPSVSTPVSVPAARKSSSTSVPAVPAPPPSRASSSVAEPKGEPKATRARAVPAARASGTVAAVEEARASTRVEAPADDERADVAPATTATKAAPEPVEEKPKAVEPAAPAPAPAPEPPPVEPAAAPEPPKAVEPVAAPEPPKAAPAPEPPAPVVEEKKTPVAASPEEPKRPTAPEAEEPAPPTTASPTVLSPAPSAPPPAAPAGRPAPSPAVTSSHSTPPSRPLPAAASGTSSVPPSRRPSTTPPPASSTGAAVSGSTPPKPVKTGIEVWSGWQKDPPTSASRPGAPHLRRTQIDINKSNMGQRPGMPQSQRPGMGSGPSSMRPGMGGSQGRPGGYGNNRRFGPPSKGGPAGKISTVERKEKNIKIEGRVNLQTLAQRMSLKATEVLQKLLQLGMQGVHINSALDPDVAKILANEFGWDVEDVSISDEQQYIEALGDVTPDEEAEPRPPIVTVMGHVDHGKTSLLDQIRKTKVAEGEAGGITQHIGAYRVQTNRGVIAFLDTPGHEAFTAMRARGANLTDIVILVVAADDGVMPQTREAVTHAKAAKVPIIVAINKIDKPGADPERVKRQLMEMELVPEEFGGNVIYVPVSAKNRIGIDDLLDNILLVAENELELRANPKRNARAVVVESMLDKGKGPVARVIVRDGTLKVGDFVLSGSSVGKIRAMTDDLGRQIKTAGPSTPVELLGLSDVPNAGDTLDAVSDQEKARELVEQRKIKERENQKPQAYSFDEVRRRLLAGDQQLELRVLVKADVQGSVEAIRSSLQKLSGSKVSLSVVDASVGAINESDVNLAVVAKAIIVGFNVRPAGKAAQLAEKEGIQIKHYTIIYQVIDEIRAAMEGLLAPIYIEKALGKAEVRVVYKLSKPGAVAGCMITQGSVKRNAKARVRREGVVVLESKVSGLKRFKEDVKEVAEGFECGVSVENYDEIKEGDIIEAFELEQVRQTL